ncbi:MAG: insulinase family protein [Acetobacter sp.]|nr:insulinase family protein [Bacteroides sp.]MCM1340936.1 insulinase family protein [Acetobacter sp.]MCM1432508.1 insulinase family protein [Clostridiales bacterium]
MSCKIYEIAEGVEFVSVNTNIFKTNELSVSLALPLKKETASVNALMINLISRKTANYPTILSLNKKLANLYGAIVSSSVSKLGDCQILKINMTGVDDRFSLDNQSIALEGVKLLCDMLFNPRLDDSGCFFAEDIDAEKRILTEKIEAEENEKRTYALKQAEKLMYADDVYAVDRYGTIDDIKNIQCSDVFTAWKNALSSSKVLVTAVGSADMEAIKNLLSSAFAAVDRDYRNVIKTNIITKCDDSIKEKIERQDIKQGKLVLGLKTGLKPDDEFSPAMRAFCDIFGGGPYSKLFANVREKMSLCYYCSARYVRAKGHIIIQCGCNEDNMDKAVNEILNQLEIIKNGDFDEELKSSKMALSDMYKSVNDTPDAIEAWYSSQIIYDELKSPLQYADENNSVTKEQVQQCASLVKLDTIYKLAAKEAE